MQPCATGYRLDGPISDFTDENGYAPADTTQLDNGGDIRRGHWSKLVVDSCLRQEACCDESGSRLCIGNAPWLLSSEEILAGSLRVAARSQRRCLSYAVLGGCQEAYHE